jgi:oligo-alginate lyase
MKFFILSILVFLFLLSGYSSNQPSDDQLPEDKILPVNMPPHPRLFFPKGQEITIISQAKDNVLLSQLIEILRKEADKELYLVPQIYTPHVQLLKVSREQISRVLTLSMAYRLFNEEKYAKKVQEELLNVCGFPSWNPEHFLDVAEMTTAAAIGYDWCFDYLALSTREAVENAIREKGFNPAWPVYERTGKTPFNRENNWNMVCNSGMVNGAIAIGDKYPEEAERIIRYAVKYTPNLLQSFAPEGAFNEGPGYWSYNGMYMAQFFDNLTRNLHNDFGLPSFEGLKNTAHFYISLVGPSRKVFNFGDASDHIDFSGTFFFLSRFYNQPEVAKFYRDLLIAAIKEYSASGSFEFPRFFFLSIPWFDNSIVAENIKEEKLIVFNGVTDLLAINGNIKSDINRIYLAAKTGRPSWSHNQLDVGSFVLDCDGERWGIDIGADSYSLPDFWDYKPGGVRWNYFRNTNMAHSTLSIDYKIATSDGQGELIVVNKDSSRPYGIFDLSPCYMGQATSVKRGFRLLSSGSILLRDEIVLNPNSQKISWRFITGANVTLKGNTAILSQNGKLFYIKCLLPNGFQLQVIPAKPYSKDEKPITGVNIVEITILATDELVSIPVLLGNKMDESEFNNLVNLQLKDWK